MNLVREIKERNCLNLGRLSICTFAGLTALILAVSPLKELSAQERLDSETSARKPRAPLVMRTGQSSVEKIYTYQNGKLLESLNPYKKIQTRGPANYVPNDEINPPPERERMWLEHVFVQDNGGVLNSIQHDMRKWQEEEAYARKWGLKSTGLYETPDLDRKKSYLEKRMLKYVEERVTGEINEAEEGSALHTIGKVEKSVKPDTEVDFSDKFKVKLKAKLLEGETFVYLRNPYFHYETRVNTSGNVDMKFRKKLEDLEIEAAVDYHADEGYYMARVDRRLFDTVTGRISSTQNDDKAVMAEDSDKRLEFFYSTNF